jgi:hypothetical protein
MDLLLVFAFAMFVRFAYLLNTIDTPIWHWDSWNQTDMDTFLTVATQILSGDVLVHNPYHPFHDWHQAIASADRWRDWYSPHAFHQIPGYSYLLALFLNLFNGSHGAIKAFQLILGSAHAAVLGAIGQHIMGRTGGLILGLLAAFYGPFIAVEPLLLREGIALLISSLAFYLMLRCLDPKRLAEQRAFLGIPWVALGITFGLGALIKETGFILFAGALLWIVGRSVHGSPRLDKSITPQLLFGFVLSLTPLILRNLTVGAPALAFASTFPFNFALANAADAPGGGVFFSTPESFRQIMDQSGGRLLPTIAATFGTYSGNPDLLAYNVWSKFSATWSNMELADNFSYQYFSSLSSILAVLPRFVCIWIPAVLGFLLLTFKSNWSVPFSRDILSLVLTILVVHVLAQSFAPVMSRYRLVMVPYLMIGCAWALSLMVDSVRLRQWAFSSGLIAGGILLTITWLAWPSSQLLQMGSIGAVDFSTGAHILGKERGFSAARDEFQRGLSYLHAQGLTDQLTSLRQMRFVYFVNQGRFSEIRDEWEYIRTTLPQHHPLLQQIEREIRRQEVKGTEKTS